VIPSGLKSFLALAAERQSVRRTHHASLSHTMKFEWDPDKAARNLKRHGISFAEATSAFGDPLSLTVDDPDHSVGEHRFILIGQTHTGRLVVVCHVALDDDETIRLISARLPSRREQKSYETG
jgi:uncharacterized DUF497 family protein